MDFFTNSQYLLRVLIFFVQTLQPHCETVSIWMFFFDFADTIQHILCFANKCFFTNTISCFASSLKI